MEPLLVRHVCKGRSEWRFEGMDATPCDLAMHGLAIRSTSKGLGIFALRPFQTGARIFGEAPLLQWKSTDQVFSNVWVQRKLASLPLADQSADF